MGCLKSVMTPMPVWMTSRLHISIARLEGHVNAKLSLMQELESSTRRERERWQATTNGV